jgi:chromosome segregation ATPase
MWVEALYMRYAQNEVFNDENNEVRTKWTEKNDASNASKCEEISIEITHNNETMLTIRVFATKGRIQVNGRLMKAWGGEEFDHVRAIINNNEEATANTTVFSNKVLKKKETHLDTNTETDNSPGEESFRTLKDIIVNLESEFVSHKVDANTKLEEMHELLKKKEKEIAMLKEEISKLKTTNNNQQQVISDLNLKHLKTEKSIKHLQSELKNEKKLSKNVPIKKPPTDKNTPQDKIESTPPTDTIPNCTIPTANRFDTLTETPSPPHSLTPQILSPTHQKTPPQSLKRPQPHNIPNQSTPKP